MPSRSQALQMSIHNCVLILNCLSTTGSFRFSGITIDHADPNIAAPIARKYPYEQWAGFFSQGITTSEFVEIGVEAARLGILPPVLRIMIQSRR